MNYVVLKADLKRDEAERDKPYLDCCGKYWRDCQCPTKGKLTVGVGRNLDDVGINESERDFLLMSDVGRAEGGLDQYLPWWRQLDEARQRVLVNMAFNLGIRGLLKFKLMLSAAQGGLWDTAADEMLDSAWAKQVGVRADRLAKLMRSGA